MYFEAKGLSPLGIHGKILEYVRITVYEKYVVIIVVYGPKLGPGVKNGSKMQISFSTHLAIERTMAFSK